MRLIILEECIMLRRILGPFNRSKDFFRVPVRRLSTELTQANGNARLKFPSTVPFSVYATGATLAVGGSVAWLKYDIKETNVRIDRLDTKVDDVKKEVTDLKQDMADLKLDLKQDMADLKLDLKQDMADLKLDLKQDIAELKLLFFQDKAQKLESVVDQKEQTQSIKR